MCGFDLANGLVSALWAALPRPHFPPFPFSYLLSDLTDKESAADPLKDSLLDLSIA
jgi:hypothetical protein